MIIPNAGDSHSQGSTCAIHPNAEGICQGLFYMLCDIIFARRFHTVSLILRATTRPRHIGFRPRLGGPSNDAVIQQASDRVLYLNQPRIMMNKTTNNTPLVQASSLHTQSIHATQE